MGLGDRIKAAAKAVKAEAVVTKAAVDSKRAGCNPDDYAKFDSDERSEEKENDK